MHKSKQRMSMASERAFSSGVISDTGLGTAEARPMRAGAGVPPNVVSASSAGFKSLCLTKSQMLLTISARNDERTDISSSTSFASRSSCTTSTTTRIKSRSFGDSLRSTSRQRATRLSGSASCEIMSPEELSAYPLSFVQEQYSIRLTD